MIKYGMEDDVDWVMALILLVTYMAANYPGAKKGLNASTTVFKMVMGMMLFVLGVFLIINQQYMQDDDDSCKGYQP